MNNKREETTKKLELNVFAAALSCIYVSCRKAAHTSFSQAGSKLLSMYKTTNKKNCKIEKLLLNSQNES